MKPFKFQKFTIIQNEKVFRVGTDGVLLGALSNVSDAENILEVGTGTGLISLMLAQRNPKSQVLAIDINKEATILASKNFKNSSFKERLKSINVDFKNFQSENRFDLIISNPPYFEENQSEKDVLARQKRELNFSELIENAAILISEHGILSVIIPSDSSNEFVKICFENQIHLIRKINIFGIENGPLKRNILEFSPSPKNLVEEDFTIEKSPRQYSDQYLELTKEFHIFRNN